MIRESLIKLFKVLLVIVLMFTSFTHHVSADDIDNNDDSSEIGNSSEGDDPFEEDDDLSSDPLIPIDNGIYEAARDGYLISWDLSKLKTNHDSLRLYVHVVDLDGDTSTTEHYLKANDTSFDVYEEALINYGLFSIEIQPYNGNEKTDEKFICEPFESYVVDVEIHAKNSKGEPYYFPDDLAEISGNGPVIVGETTSLKVTPVQGFEFLYFMNEGDNQYTDNPLEVTGIDENVTYRAYLQGDISGKLSVDFGQGHEKLLQKLYEMEKEYVDDISIDGAKINVKFDTPLNVEDLLNNLESFITGEDIYEDYTVFNAKDYFDNGELFFGASLKPTNEYSTMIDYIDNRYSDDLDRLVKDGETIYLNWLKPIDSVKMDIDNPQCGDEVYAENYHQYHAPEVLINGLDNYHVTTFYDIFGDYFPDQKSQEIAYWVEPENPDIDAPDFNIFNGKLFEGTIEGDKDYYALIAISTDFGYYFTRDTQSVTVNDSDEFKIRERAEENSLKELAIYTFVKLKAEHDFILDKMSFNDIPGKEHSDCDADHDEIVREFIYSLDSRVIKTFDKSNPQDLIYIYKRSLQDENTYMKFNVVAVDDRPLESGEFETGKGSLILQLNKDYLKTLSNGEHELLVGFIDGYVTIKFNVVDGSGNRPTLPKTGIE